MTKQDLLDAVRDTRAAFKIAPPSMDPGEVEELARAYRAAKDRLALRDSLTDREVRAIAFAMRNPMCSLKSIASYAGGGQDGARELVMDLGRRGLLGVYRLPTSTRTGAEQGYTRYEIRATPAARELGIDPMTAPRVVEKFGANLCAINRRRRS